jgi:DNA-binding NarL/FixJ family response regulator
LSELPAPRRPEQAGSLQHSEGSAKEAEQEPIRILLADDHPVVRDGLAAILSTQPDFLVVGAAASGTEAVQAASVLHPDVVLLDIEMPGMDGVEALKQMKAAQPAARALIFTAFDTDERIMQAVRAGAQGYLLKGAPREEVFNAIRVVHAGGSLLHPVAASHLLRHIREGQTGSASDSHQDNDKSLTSREIEVLRLLARGLQNKEISAELGVSVRTVKFHVTNILSKLNAGNRTEALSIAAQQGLISL